MKYFSFRRRVSFHETDMMGVVHHSNYVKLFEEVRVAWLRERKLMEHHVPHGPYTFAVVKVDIQFLKPARFDDEIEVLLRMRQVGARLEFQYAAYHIERKELLSEGETVLVPVNQDLKPVRLSAELRAAFAKESVWSPQWPPVFE